MYALSMCGLREMFGVNDSCIPDACSGKTYYRPGITQISTLPSDLVLNSKYVLVDRN